MKILVLWASDDSPNLGVRVLGAGTQALARMAWPGCDVTFHNYGAGSAPVRLGSPRALAKEAITGRGRLREWFRTFDVVLDTRAGDSFTDIYGLHRHLAMSATAELATRQGARVVLSPQTIGPFDTHRGRALGRRSLHQAALVMARDTVSADVAAHLGRAPVVVTTDVVFALPVPDAVTSRDVILNVSGLLWNPNPHVDAATYRTQLARLYRRLVAQGRTVTLLAHVLASKSADNDVPAVEEFRRTEAPDAELIVPDSLDHVRTVMAGASLVIGSRMHACLNALSVGVPAIPLAYSRKFAPLMGDLGWQHVVDLRDRPDSSADQALAIAGRLGLTSDVDKLRSTANASLSQAADALRPMSAVGVA